MIKKITVLHSQICNVDSNYFVSFNLLDQNIFSQGDGYMHKNGNVVPRVVYVARACVQMCSSDAYTMGVSNPQFPLGQ